MNNRKAFTLVELLVVIGIITILMGLLLPAISQMHRSAQITGQKADFQTIATALDAYKADFGDYPKNDVLTRFTTNLLVTPAVLAPIHLTLAAALMGAGPQVTQTTSGGIYMVGDGADGLGFRAQTTNYPIPIGTLMLTGSPPSVTASTTLPPQLGSFIPGQTTGSITMSVGTIYEETVGFVVDATTPNQLDLTATPVFSGTPGHQITSAGDKYLIKVPTGKVTPNYLSADTFKVVFVQVNNTLTGGPGTGFIGSAGEPLLLDRWGQVIQYFPRYGPASNRTSDSWLYSAASTAAKAAVQAGPLYGESQPMSVDTNNGENAIFDWRDGAPFFTSASTTILTQVWPSPPPNPSTVSATYYPRLDWAIQWMLGDQTFADAISAPQTLRNDGPYILISAGPDGPTRLNGGYCNFANQSTGALTDPTSGNPLTQSQLLQMFIASGNVYNFDHP
jgi:prepilin-type N-terminal cleavage/methylation domain-containing protein